MSTPNTATSSNPRNADKPRRLVYKLSRKISLVLTWRPRTRVSRLFARLLAGLLAASASTAMALPTGERVVAGGVTVQRPDASSMTVTQTTQKGIIDWTGYNIGAGEAVRYLQPGASAVTLNRVTGGDPSAIFGSLSANGQLFLVNPAGVYFAPGAQVNVGALVAATLNISNEDFLAGRYVFENAGAAGGIDNQGALAGRYVALIAPQISNSGSITTAGGTAALAAGDRVSLDFSGDGLVAVSVDAAAAGAAIRHAGSITADGGRVFITARSADALLDTVLNVSGLVRAQSLNEVNGVITLDGGPAGVVAVSGTLDASGRDAGETGGAVTVQGRYVGLYDGARLDASGDAGGGTVLVGGDYQGNNPELRNAHRTYVAEGATLAADATGNGDGGRVVVWADDVTRFYGTLSARGGALGGNGGFAEVSGKESLVYRGRADLSAQAGAVGSILFDPKNITIGQTGPFDNVGANDAFGENAANSVTFSANDIGGTLDGANVTLQANNDITIDEAIQAAGAGALTLQAGRSILIKDNITLNDSNFSATANSTVADGVVDAQRDSGDAVITMNTGTSISVGSGTVSLTISTGPTTNKDSGAITLDNISAANLIVANNGATGASAKSIIDNNDADLTISGNASFTAASITLGNHADDATNFGSLTFTSTGTVTISEDSATTLAGNSTAGSLTLVSNGAITDTGTISITGTTSLTAGAANDITLDNANNFGGAVSVVSGNTVTLTDSNAIVL
nr:filamentous hemagglutinin N-terminal domain-containing protein [Thiobacillaceae bacterium]